MTRPALLLLACSSLVVGQSSLCIGTPAMTIQSFTSGQSFAASDSAPDAAADDYSKGTQALDQQRWQDAITAFDRVVTAHSKRADAALYWKAYALNKLGRINLVSATCGQLHTTYPRSTWNRDCSALSVTQLDPGIYAGAPGPHDTGIHSTPQPNDNGIYRSRQQNLVSPEQLRDLQSRVQKLNIQAGPNADQLRDLQKQLRDMNTESGLNGVQLRTLQKQLRSLNVQAGPNADQLRNLQQEIENIHVEIGPVAGSDADLKMLALNSLLQREPAQALPMIRNILTGNNSQQLKQRALTALAMNQSPDAQSLLRDVATGKIAPAEQRQAIQMLGVFQGKRSEDTLTEIYRSSPDRDIKRAALSGLFIANDAPRLVELARNEKDLQLKHDIVAHLALMQDKVATDYMLELLK